MNTDTIHQVHSTVERDGEVGGLWGGKAFFIGGESKLKEVAWCEPNVRVAANAIGVGGGPGNRVAFKGDNGHARRNSAGDPAFKLRGFRDNSGAGREVEVASNGERRLIREGGGTGRDATRSRGTEDGEKLSVEKVKSLIQREA